MIAVQFQTVKEPVIRDTRDTMELRSDLIKEKETYLSLMTEVNSNEEKLEKYESEMENSKGQVLSETLEELKVEAGLTEVEGPGIMISIEHANEGMLVGKEARPVSPYLIRRLINELNRYGAKNISIADQRIINTTVIRDINGETKVDGYSLTSLPINIKVVADSVKDAEKLFKYMQVSESADEFFIDNFLLTISEPQPKIRIPAYKESIKIQQMKAAENGQGG